MGASIIRMPGLKEVPQSTPQTLRSTMETMIVTPTGVERWKLPPFQREKRITPKVEALIKQIAKDGGIVPGIITLGKCQGETWLVDGQHRIEAFKMSGVAEGIADVRVCYFKNMADMADEFVTLNSSLVRMRNDDILRGLEGQNAQLARIRKECPFVGYGNARIGVSSPSGKTLLMAATLRAWFGTAGLMPNTGPSGPVAAGLLNEEETTKLIEVLEVCFKAWGQDKENYRLWGVLNMSMIFWMWRRMVLKEGGSVHKGGVRSTTLTVDQFMRCLMALSADQTYTEWLLGRNLKLRDRSPAYNRIKAIFTRRILAMGLPKPFFPMTTWAST